MANELEVVLDGATDQILEIKAAGVAGEMIGDLATLTTTDKSSVINAINEINSKESNNEYNISKKISKPVSNPNGTAGQLLRTMGNGNTEWVNFGLPTDAQTAAAISAWLAAHPEATTTVQNGSITPEKIAAANSHQLINDYSTPHDFGAVGDGTTDDSEALLDCAEYCAANNKLLYIPTDCKIKVPTQETISGVKNIQIDGKIVAPNGIVFQFDSSKTCNKWSFNNVDGELILKGLKRSIIEILYATTLRLYADDQVSGISSIAYNIFFLGYVPTVVLQGVNGGWINENMFYGGGIRSLLIADGGAKQHNNNHWYHPTLESTETITAKIEFYIGSNNYIHDLRGERGVNVIMHEKAACNVIQRTYEANKFPIEPPITITDDNGTNLMINGNLAAYEVREKIYTVESYNYNCEKLYPYNGKLHNASSNGALFGSDLIDISKGVCVLVDSDTTFFRARFEVYDENGDQITTEPANSPCTPAINWNDTYYRVALQDKKQSRYRFATRNLTTLLDSGVKYIKVLVSGSSAANLGYFRVAIVTPTGTNQHVFKEDRLTATAMPSNGEWKNGLICYNIGTTYNVLGWYYLDGSWHAIPFSN